jgi:TfoX/Sxy family transcriptional regulator of competence genes
MLCQELQAPNALGSNAVAEVNKKFMDKGITCNDIVIQRITMDDAILKREQEIFVQKRQHEMNMQQERAQFEREKAAILQKAEIEQLNRDKAVREQDGRLALQLSEERAKHERALLEAETEAKRRKLQGFDKEDVLELRRIEAQERMFSGQQTRVVYAPLDFWRAPRTVVQDPTL